MKKLLIGLLIALAVMVMLVFALNACDRVGQTAEAEYYYTVYSDDGLVLPNVLGYDQLPSDMVEVSYNGVNAFPSDTPAGVYFYRLNPSGFTMSHNNDGSWNLGGCYIYVVYDISTTGYYSLTSFCSQVDNNSYVSMTKRLVSTGSITNFSPTVFDGIYFANDYVSQLYSAGDKVITLFKISGGWPYVLNFNYIKLEFYSSIPSGAHPFTGFVVPDLSYIIPAGEYDSWDGVVLPNLLNGADLFEYPYYFVHTPEAPGISNQPRDVYYSDAPTSCFHTEYGLTGLVDMPVCVISDNRNTADLLSNEVTLKYRYTYQDLFPDMLPYYNLTYTLCASGFNSCHISMATNSSYFVDLTVNGSDVLGFGEPISLSLVDGVPVAFTYVDITVTFYSVAARDLSVYFYYSKLEAGDLFTGFVPLEHSDLTVVNYDLLPNFDFSSAPIHRLDNGEFDIRANDVNWFITGLEYQNFTISFPVQGGLRVQCPSEYGYSLIYDFVPDEVGIANYMNFALKAFSNVAFTVEVYHYDDRDDTSNVLPIKSCYFLRSSTVHDISFSFPFASDGVRIILGIDGISDTTFYYSKLEYGDVFTGYCENSEIMYNRAYDAGYTDGSVDAVDQFKSATYTWTFGQEGQWLRLDTGWFELGFSSGEDLRNGYFTLYPEFYTANGIPIAASGYFLNSQNSVPFMVTVYASRYDVSNLELLDEYTNIYIVYIYEHYSTLLAQDDTFTPDYLVYDRNRTVSLNVTRGLENITDFYNDAIYNDGYQTGYVDGEDFGYVQGRARGYSEAVKYYQEIGSTGGWFGFISAFIDVPISVITNLLDWDFFGFNLLNIIKVLILFSLTFLVLRLITKGRAQV